MNLARPADNYDDMKLWMNYIHAATKFYDARQVEHYSKALASQEEMVRRRRPRLRARRLTECCAQTRDSSEED